MANEFEGLLETRPATVATCSRCKTEVKTGAGIDAEKILKSAGWKVRNNKDTGQRELVCGMCGGQSDV